jgi:predicted acetyltransferase
MAGPRSCPESGPGASGRFPAADRPDSEPVGFRLVHSVPMPTFRPFDPSRDDAAVRRALALAFGGTPEGMGAYFELVGRDQLRVLDEGANAGTSTVTSCLAKIPMGHWFGGRPVSTVGIAAVAVAPESRGGKRALTLMQECVREVAADGAALVSLYASTQALYRQVGFEQAGSKFETRLPLRQLTAGTRDLPIEPVEAHSDGVPNPRLVECQRAFAAAFEGCLERGPFVWKRIQQNREQSYSGFAVVPDGVGGTVEGYVFVGQVRRDSGRYDVVLSDCAFTTRRAAMRILGLLRDFTSMGLTLSFTSGPCHPLVTLLPQQWIEMSFKEYWMIRIARLEHAIAARGYAPSVAAELPIAINDDLLPANAGAWQLTVRGGSASVARTKATPRFRCDIRTFAAIYSGFLSPRQAILLGAAEGDAEAAGVLGGVFAGTAPWMPDHF